ncbi:MAG: hypothetical protein OXI23_10270 [Gemmatimonadota bacterium]|nr:hypothetical protein [Gemmatimonadota bacterium]
MKSLKMLSVLVGVLCVAQSSEGVVNIQNVGSGARAQGLGNSFVAVADNADAVFANPAGLGQVTQRQVAYTNVSLLYAGIEGDDLGQHVVSYAQPLGDKMGLGLGYERIGSSLMSENGAFVSLSYQVERRLQVGLSAKYLFWSVGAIPDDEGRADPLSNQSAGNVGVDLGLLWQSPVQGAQVGVLLKNINQPNVAYGEVAGDPDAGALPMDVHVGVGYRLSSQSLVSVQYVRRDLTGEDSDHGLVVGGETQLVEGLLLRAGGRRLLEEDAGGGLNAGLGYQWNQLVFDYAYDIGLDLTETNGAHRFSFAYEF